MDEISFDAEGEYRRIEVLTGPGRRRRWSASEKAQAVAETLVPGASVSAVARRWQVHPQQLFSWRRAARTDVLAAPPGLEALTSVPVVSDAPSPPRQGGTSAASTEVEITLAGAVLRVAISTDTALLTDVLRAIRASAT